MDNYSNSFRLPSINRNPPTFGDIRTLLAANDDGYDDDGYDDDGYDDDGYDDDDWDDGDWDDDDWDDGDWDDDDWDDGDCDDDDWDDGDCDDDDWDDGDCDDDDDILHRHLVILSKYYPLWLDDEDRFVIVQDVKLPPGYNYQETDFLVRIPPDYPFSPPGMGDNRIYTYSDLRYQECRLVDLHPETTPRFLVRDHERWAWFCYQTIDWSPVEDDLIKLLEMIRADLTNPRIV